MFKKPKKFNNHKKDWKKDFFTIFLGFLSLLELLRFFKKKKNKKIRENFIKFLKKEEVEVEQLVEGKEGVEEFLEDSGNIFKNFFIPTKDNGYKPKILHTKTLIATGLILASLKFVLAGYLFFIYPYQGMMNEFFNDQLLSLINKDRISQELGTVEFNEELNASAMAKAQDLIQNDYFAHVSPDGKKPWDWINRDNYKYLLVGENLAMNFTSPESVHRALMLSPSHKKNILNGEYKDIGLAVLDGSIDGKETTVLVELFSIRQEVDVRLASVAPPAEEIIEPKIEIIPSVPVDNELEIKSDISPEDENKIAVISELDLEQDDKKQEESISNIKAIPPPPPTLPNFDNVRKKNLALSEAQVLASELTAFDDSKIQEDKKIAQLSQFSGALENVESNNLYKTKVFANDKSDAKAYAGARLQYFNYFLFAFLLIISAFLIINIIIRLEVQHKHVIIQTIFLMIFVAGLISLKFDFLSSVLPKILIV